MAIYRIFPEADAFLNTELTLSNTGLDEIIELGGYEDASGAGRTNRIVTRFKTKEIKSLVDDHLNGASISASLNYMLADAYEIPTNYLIECFPLAQSWDNGKGKFGDLPVDLSGVSWEYTKINRTIPWATSGFSPNITASFPSSFPGGGTWYTGSEGYNLKSSKTYTVYDSHDLSLDVSNTVNLFYSESISNYGFLVKLDDSLEFNTSTNIRLKYYSKDTNTVYPPYLEMKWDDSSYETGSLEVLSSDINYIGIKNNKERYKDEGKTRFRITARPKFPTRTFTTSSIYLTNYALPINSYWGIKDEFSEEMIIDFDPIYTKVSCDSSGPYFDVFMNSFQPERYYRLLIKTTLDSSEVVYADKNIFKVVRNV